MNLRGRIALSGMPQQEARQGFGIRRDVEQFVGGDTREGARGNVPDRIAARLASRDAFVRHTPHDRFDVGELEEVKLEVLARRDMREAARVVLGNVGQRLELPTVSRPCGIFTRSICTSSCRCP